MDIQLPIQLPTIDLSTVIPLLALVLLAALILVALTARTLIKSRAFTIALVAAVVILGSSTIVGSLQSIALLIGVAGVAIVAVVVALGRNNEVLDVVRTAVEKQAPRVDSFGSPVIDQPAQPKQLPAGQALTRQSTRPSVHINRPPEGWGF